MQLMPHQIDALNRTEDKNHVAYYLDMGLGKTFVGAEKLYLLNNKINLVICQKSKVADWVEHFKKYYPEYKIYDMTDNHKAAKRSLDYGFWLNYRNGTSMDSILVINYELAFRRKELLQLRDFTLMLDESSLIQNEYAKRSRFILKLKPESVILLSGTPTSGKYEKLWSQLRLLGWDIAKSTFYASYIETRWLDFGGFQREVVTGYKNVDHLKKRLIEYGAVFMKTDEVMELPDQTEQMIYLSPTPDYKKFQKSGYLRMKDGTEIVGDNSLTKILGERQLCGMYHKDKLEAFTDLINSTEDRLIVFYNFNRELELLTKIAAAKPISIVNGSVKDLKAYESKDNSITFVQYQAGAMGLNLQKANKVIYFTLPLGKGSCDLWEQSKKRIHRIGQTKGCFYYYLLVKNSIELKNLESLRLGRDLTNELFKNQ